ncbi:MAG TPA: HNH endonuclease signature motif containing protein [Syntrophomonas sp.]|nr:HNH endonuclease signature motif containing protein [Syntrophomonas sp.]
MKDREKIIDALLKRDGTRCSICGEPLDGNIDIDHKLPKSAGYGDELENLQLAHSFCNMIKGNSHYFTEFQFQSFIQSILMQSDKYTNVQTNVAVKPDHRVISREDIVFYRKMDSKKMIAEIKSYSSLTGLRVDDIIDQLNTYRKFDPDASVLLIIPGTLPAEYRSKLKDAQIDLWDRDYISTEFSHEISMIDHPLSKRFQARKKEVPSNRIEELIHALQQCPAGTQHWSKYQGFIGEIITLLFCPPLKQPIKELFDMNKVNRRDFILPNYTQDGFWKFMRDQYHADYIVIDAKNSGMPIKKRDVLQIGNYLKRHGAGLFAMIFSRKGQAKNIEYTLSELWGTQGKLIVILSDNDIEQMLLLKMNGGSPVEVIQQKIEDFRLSI